MHRIMFSLTCINSLLPSLADLSKSARLKSIRVLIASTLCVMAVLAVVFISTGVKNALAPSGSHDFQWTPSKDVVDGIDPYRDFITWNELGNDAVPPHFLNQSPSYPASTYILLSPFAHFEWETAKLLWVSANLIFIGLLLIGMQKVFPVHSPTILAVLGLSFLIASPLRISLGAGQHNFISLAAFIWAYYFAHTGQNKGLAGLLLSVAWIKYSLTFPLTLIFLKRGTFKPVIIAAGIHAILTCIAAWRIGMWPHEFFFSSVKVVLMGDGTGFLNLIALSMTLNLPLAIPLLFIGMATLAVTWMLYRNEEADPALVLTFLGLFSCAVFYHHGYDFIVLLLCAWLLARGGLEGALRYSTICLLATAWVGHWLTKEFAPIIGPYPEICVNYILMCVFYYTMFVYAKALYKPGESLKPATAVTF